MKKNRAEVQSTSPAPLNLGVFRRMLEEKREELMKALGVKFDSIASAGRVAEEDQAQLSHEEFVNLLRNKQDYQVLKLVKEALDRLTTGEFGICQRCEESISPRRLEVLPWAKYCVRCQERIAAREHEEEDSPVLAGSW